MVNDKVSWSDEVYRLLDLAPGSILPYSGLYSQYIAPEDKQRVTAAFERQLQQDDPDFIFEIEYGIISAAGKHKQIHSGKKACQ
jgi:hypothetical protein